MWGDYFVNFTKGLLVALREMMLTKVLATGRDGERDKCRDHREKTTDQFNRAGNQLGWNGGKHGETYSI